MAVASTSMARRLEMWRGAHAASLDDVEAMTRHFRRAAELAGQKSPGERCEALANLGFEYARIAALRGNRDLLQPARQTAEETLDAARQMKGQLPWVSVAHATLALVAEAEGDYNTAADEARKALEIDGETYVNYFIPILWVAARTLIATGEPEAPSLSAEIIGGLSYLAGALGDPEIRDKWFATPMIGEVARIVGFDPATSLAAEEPPGAELTEGELATLRELAFGAGGSRGLDPGAVDELLAKIGVATTVEAIQYAIQAGVTWR
jgi:tetratricopeptide (TPR) repeat protein